MYLNGKEVCLFEKTTKVLAGVFVSECQNPPSSVSSLSFPLLRFLPLLPQSSISLTVLPTILSFTDSGDDSLEECVNGCEADDNGEQARA